MENLGKRKNNSSPGLSLIVPIYNEEKILERNVRYLYHYLIEILPLKNFEIILVNNGSTDKTPEILENLKKSYQNIKIFSYPKRELGRAIKIGIENIGYETGIIYSIDLPFGREHIQQLLENQEGNSFVVGSKWHPLSRVEVPFFRRLFSKVCNRLIRWLFHFNVLDTQGSLLFKKELLKKYLPLLNSSGAWLQAQILIYGNFFGIKIKEIPVDYNYFSQRPSKIKLSDALRFLSDLFKEIFQYKKLTHSLR